MKIDTMEQALTLKLCALQDMEEQIIEALPKMISAAKDKTLKESLQEHLEKTQEQLERVQQAAEALGVELKPLEVEGIRGIIKDGEWNIKEIESESDEIRDTILVSSANYVEHYESAGYIMAVEMAKKIGNDAVEDLLQQNLDEEVEAAETLLAFVENEEDEEE